MTRKANRVKRQFDQPEKRPDRFPINIFGCPDCELLIFEYPEKEKIDCPWCHRPIDVHARYTFMYFAPGVNAVGSGRPVIVE